MESEEGAACDWAKVYSMSVSAAAAPVTCFKHCPLVEFWMANSFVGLVAEVPNDLYKKSSGTKQKPAALSAKDGKTTSTPMETGSSEEAEYFFAIIVEIAGYRARMRYLGGESNTFHDIWLNICDSSVHHVGWAATNGRSIVPPPHMREQRSDWSTFLVERLTGVSTLPSDFNNRVCSTLKRSNIYPLRKGMRVEVADRTCLGRMKRAVVDKVVGGRLRLRYISSQIAGDYFWCHRLSNLLHHIGWSKKVGHSIDASQAYKESSFHKALTGSYEPHDAGDSVFHRPPSLWPNFMKGMAVEAVDPLNLSQICIATIAKVLEDGYVMLAFDESATAVAAAAGSQAAAAQLRATEMVGVVTSFSGSGNKSEGEGSESVRSEVNLVCYHSTSPYLLPPGFCRTNGVPLTLPTDLAEHATRLGGGGEESFVWEQYATARRSCNYNPAPAFFFTSDVPDHGFEVGMHLEAVDLMEPRLICIATVSEVKGRLLRVHFNGWDTSYDQWMDCRSPDIYPIGWCELVRHPIESVPDNSLNSRGKKSLKRRKRRRKMQQPVSVTARDIAQEEQEHGMMTGAARACIDSSVASDDQSVIMLNEISPVGSVAGANDSSNEPPPLSDPLQPHDSSNGPPSLSDPLQSQNSSSEPPLLSSHNSSNEPPSLSDPLQSQDPQNSSSEPPPLSDPLQSNNSSNDPPSFSDPPQLTVDTALSTSNEEMPELSPVPLSVVQRTLTGSSTMKRY